MSIFSKSTLYDLAGYAAVALGAFAASVVLGGILALMTTLRFVESVVILTVFTELGLVVLVAYKRRVHHMLLARFRTRKARKRSPHEEPMQPVMVEVDEEGVKVATLPPPPIPPDAVDDYYELRHPLFFCEVAVPVGLGILAVSGLLIWTSGLGQSLFVVLVAIAVGALLIYRRWVEWRKRPIELRKDENILKLHQGGTLWLGLGNSEPDPYPLANASLITPDQGVLEQVLEQFFGSSSQTVVFPVNRYKHRAIVLDAQRVTRVRDVGRILAIQEWRSKYELYLQEDQAYQARAQTLEAIRSRQLQKRMADRLDSQ